MPEIKWLLEETVLAIHKRQIAEHGGSDGVRDLGLLLSALARPQNLLAYSEDAPDISALAALMLSVSPKIIRLLTAINARHWS